MNKKIFYSYLCIRGSVLYTLLSGNESSTRGSAENRASERFSICGHYKFASTHVLIGLISPIKRAGTQNRETTAGIVLRFFCSKFTSRPTLPTTHWYYRPPRRVPLVATPRIVPLNDLPSGFITNSPTPMGMSGRYCPVKMGG